MRRSALSSLRAALALLPLLVFAQPLGLQHKGELWERDFFGTAPIAHRLRVNAHGPVTLQAGTYKTFSYSVRVSVHARTEAEAQRVLQRYTVRVDRLGDTTVLTAPGGPVISTVTVKTPRL